MRPAAALAPGGARLALILMKVTLSGIDGLGSRGPLLSYAPRVAP